MSYPQLVLLMREWNSMRSAGTETEGEAREATQDDIDRMLA